MKEFVEIDAAEVEAKAQEGAIFLDIRDQASFDAGHIQNAIHLADENIEAFLARADRAKPVVVYCYHGFSSQNAAEFLLDQGFENVFSLKGGYEGFRPR